MAHFKCILFAADFSEASRDAFGVACSLAPEGEGRILVLHVLEAVHVAEELVYMGPESGRASSCFGGGNYHHAVEERLRRFYVPGRPIAVSYRVADGSPAEEIVRAAGESGCDLIAMGTHGRTGLTRLLAGSVAESVLRRASCPVLALRASDAASGAGPGEVILHPTDFSETSRPALQAARELARDRGARLVVAHVMPLEYLECGAVPAPLDVRAVRRDLEALARSVDGPDLVCPVETRLVEGEPADTILRLAAQVHCNMIVMGTHGRGGLSRLLMGSVAEAVTRRAGCSVLTIRAPGHAVTPSDSDRLVAVGQGDLQAGR